MLQYLRHGVGTLIMWTTSRHMNESWQKLIIEIVSDDTINLING